MACSCRWALCYLAVGSSVIANLFAIMLFPENKRLTEAEAFLTLLFDLAQLCVPDLS